MKRKEHFLMGVPCFIIFILDMTNIYTGFLFEVKNGIYYRGPYIMVVYAFAALYMLVSVGYFFYHYKKTNNSVRVVMFDLHCINDRSYCY